MRCLRDLSNPYSSATLVRRLFGLLNSLFDLLVIEVWEIKYISNVPLQNVHNSVLVHAFRLT